MYSQLDQLLVEAEELNVDICDDYEDLPRVERNLSQLLNEAREMRSRLQESSDTQAVQANLLLSSCGVNLPQMSAQLEAISSQKPFELLESTFESDIAKQINEQWQTLFLSTLEQNNQNTFQTIMNETIENEISNWNQTAKNFMDSFVCPNGGDNDFKVPLQTTSTTSMTGSALKSFPKQMHSLKDNKLVSSRQEANLHSNFLHFAELEFAKVIQKYNERLVYGEISPNDLFPMLREVVDKVPEASNKEVWRLVEFMSKVRSDIDRFERDTSTETNVYRCDEIMVGALVKRAKEYLENRYRTFMENLVTENLEMAKRGGVPGLLSLVLAFINVRLKNGYANMIPEDKYDKRPLWPVVYFCIRSGDLQAALFVLNSLSGERFANLKAFLDMKVRQNDLDHSVDVSYAKSVHKRLSEEFALVRNSFDIYKRATFTVLVGTEPDDFLDSQLFKTTDDDLWSKLCLIYGSGSLNMDENGLTYNKIQKGISEECGENYYRPYVYFELLMLTGQFEIAIDFLWRLDNSQKVKALHMAIALNELGLLNITKSAQAPLLQKERKINSIVCWLNLVRMVVGYTRVWEANEPLFALNYFFLLRHIPDIDNKTAFLTQVARLVISTGNIDEIFGTLEIGSMGQSIVRLDGLIDKFFLEPVQVMNLINYTAEELEKRGFIEQSIIVYNLANSEQKVLSLACRFLSQILSMKIGNEEPPAVKERFLHFCRTILSHQYPAPNMISCPLSTTQLISTLHILLRYSTVLELLAAKRIEEALERCTELDLLPKSVADVEEKVTLVKSLSVEIHNVLPDIMVTAMKMLHTLSKKVEFDLSKVDFVDIDTKSKLLKHYKDRAKAITHFAGMIPLVISEELCSNLIRLEIEMNS